MKAWFPKLRRVMYRQDFPDELRQEIDSVLRRWIEAQQTQGKESRFRFEYQLWETSCGIPWKRYELTAEEAVNEDMAVRRADELFGQTDLAPKDSLAVFRFAIDRNNGDIFGDFLVYQKIKKADNEQN